MEDPFFGRLWDRFPGRRSQQNTPYYYSNPYHAAPCYNNHMDQEAPKIKSKSFTVPVSDPSPRFPSSCSSNLNKHKKVVSIPVNFVDSDAPKRPSSDMKKKAMDESEAAVKIQAAFRGFSVRKSEPLKNLRVIMKVKAEGEEILRRISDGQIVELIKRNEKEQLQITEWIMSLLLKLDAIQGVNSFVRETRKAVIRELVHLQEAVDAMIADKTMEEMDVETSSNPAGEDECPNLEENASAEEIKEEGLADQVEGAPANKIEANPTDVQIEESLPSQMQDMQIEGSSIKYLSEGTDKDNGLEKLDKNFLGARQNVSEPEERLTADAGEDAEKLRENNFGNQVLEHDVSHNPSLEEDAATRNQMDDEKSSEPLDPSKAETTEDAGRGEADEKMEIEEIVDADEAGGKLPKRELAVEDIGMVREENDRLKKMLADLLKKSETQNEMINKLSLRIAQLEEQVSRKKKIAGQRKKTKGGSNNHSVCLTWDENENASTATSTDERMAQPNERRRRRRKSNRHLNGLREDWF